MLDAGATMGVTCWSTGATLHRALRSSFGAMPLVELVLFLLASCGFVGCLQYAFMEATALHVAAYAANLTCVQLLLECKGVDVNSQQHARRMTPLMLAAMGGHDEIVEALRAHGARLEPTDSLGRTARAWARRFGHSPDDLPALRPEWRPAEAPPRDGSATPR